MDRDSKGHFIKGHKNFNLNPSVKQLEALKKYGEKFRYKKGFHQIMTEEHRLNIQKAQLARREDARVKRLNQKHISMKDNQIEQIVKKQLDTLGFKYESNKRIYNASNKKKIYSRSGYFYQT